MIIRYTHLDRHLFIMVLQLILLGSTLAHGAGIVVDHNSVDLSSLLDSDIARAASLRVLMRHASVGQGINWGLDCLAGLHPTNSACSDFPAGKYDRANWLFELRGGNWQEKVNDLVAQTVSRANDFDVFMMKFCYIDALGNNHPDWDYFSSCIEQLEADFPDKRFVWWTIPLTRDGQPGTDVFNAWIRSYCLSNDKILFDIADIECHDPDGTILTNAQGNEIISQNYTKEIHAGHLNIEGRVRVASALWRLMATIAEDMYEPDALQLLTPNAGERWIAGKTYTISWSYTGSISLVVIEYSIDLGVTWTAVGPPVPSDSGGYDWRIPAVSTNQCLIRVSSAENPNISDTSDEVFMLFIRAAIYVDADATGANNGTSWENAYTFLQDGLADANDSAKPVEIRVAQGTYKPDQGANQTPGDREATFQLINGVTLKGEYAGLGEADPNARDITLYETILNGDLSGDDIEIKDWQWQSIDDAVRRGNREENSWTVVTGSGTDRSAVLDGFTITSGHADGPVLGEYPDFDYRLNSGGGMCNQSGNPTVINCTFRRNTTCGYDSETHGAGMFNSNSNLTLRNCHFIENIAFGANASSEGGGMYNVNSDSVLIDCVFSRNVVTGFDSGYSGGGMYNCNSSPTLVNCDFIGNGRDYSRSGAMVNAANSCATLTNCTFIANIAGDVGAISIDDSDPVLIDCTFRDNSARHFAGAVLISGYSRPKLINCIFSGNTASEGGGILTGFRSSAVLKNCIFKANTAGEGGGINNSGAWYNDPNSATLITGCTFIANSASKGGGMYNGWNRRTTAGNCSFAANSALKGGGIYYDGSEQKLTNCTFTANSAENGNALACDSYQQGRPSSLQVINCILWAGGNEVFNGDGSELQITYSDVESGWPGEGNIDSDPLFANPGYWDPNGTPDDPNDDFWIDGDYHLKSQAGRWDRDEGRWTKDDVTSPCIDAGDMSSPIGLEPFPNGAIINMGAYGGTAGASKSYFGKAVCETIVAGDINGDCKVDFRDFALMALHWLEDNSGP